MPLPARVHHDRRLAHGVALDHAVHAQEAIAPDDDIAPCAGLAVRPAAHQDAAHGVVVKHAILDHGIPRLKEEPPRAVPLHRAASDLEIGADPVDVEEEILLLQSGRKCPLADVGEGIRQAPRFEAELGLHRTAYEYFGHATRLDLDDCNRNAWEGLHTTSMAAAWRTIVEGFGGMRTDGALLGFNPSLPAKWKSFSFRIIYRGSILQAHIDRRAASFTVLSGRPLEIEVFGRRYRVGEQAIGVKLPAHRRG